MPPGNGKDRAPTTASTSPTLPEGKALLGKRALIVGIANQRSIAYGCARVFRHLGAELAITYLNEKAKPYVEPLARELQAQIFAPCDVSKAGELEGVFEQIGTKWGESRHRASLDRLCSEGGPARASAR